MHVARPSPFRSPAFRLVWGSSLATAGAQWMERVATAWLALEASGGSLGVGIVFAARMLPYLLFGLAAGTFADRLERRRLIMASAVGSAVLAALLGLLTGYGGAGLLQVTAFALLFGCLEVADTPARQALAVDTVGRDRAPNAIALNAVATRLFAAAGALGSGLLIPTFGIANVYLVVAVSFLASMALAAGIRVPPIHRNAARPSFGQALSGAWRLILDRPAVRTLVLASMACEVFAFSHMTVVPALARDVLEAGPAGLGALTSAAAFGAMLAVLLLAWLPGAIPREPLLSGVYLLFGFALIALAVAPSLPAAVAVMMVVGACASAFDALQQTLIQLAVPEDQRGRAVGIWVFSIGTAPVGHLEIGALAAVVGAQTALAANSVFVVAGGLALLAVAPSFRWRRARVDARA